MLASRALRWDETRLSASARRLAGELGERDDHRRARADALAAALVVEGNGDHRELLSSPLPLTEALRSATATLARAGRWDELEQVARAGGADLHQRITLQAFDQRRPELALRLAAEAGTDTAEALWTSLARRAEAQGRFDVVAYAAEHAFPTVPVAPTPAIEMWLRAKRAVGDPVEATRLVRAIAQRSSDDEVRRWAVHRLLSCRALDEAAHLAAQLPRTGEGPVLEVRALLLARRYDEARQRIAALSASPHPHGGELHALRAELQHRTWHLDEALEAYLAALAVDESHPSADTWRLAALRLAVERGDDRADQLAEELHVRRPDDRRVLRLRVRLAAREGSVDAGGDALVDDDLTYERAAGAAEGHHLHELHRILAAGVTG